MRGLRCLSPNGERTRKGLPTAEGPLCHAHMAPYGSCCFRPSGQARQEQPLLDAKPGTRAVGTVRGSDARIGYLFGAV